MGSLESETSLSPSLVQSGLWVFALRAVEQILNFIKLIILGRLLAPADFGLMGIALLSVSIFETFSQTGFQQTLIQKKEKIKDYLDTVWTILIFRGVILYLLIYSSAPYVSFFFKVSEAKLIIQIAALSILFQGFSNVGVVYFQKELEFNKEFFYRFSGTLADFAVSVCAVLILKNVWALILGFLAGNFVRFIISYYMHAYRPKFNFNFQQAKELFVFGKWVLGFGILIFLITQGDDIFVGKILGITMLGFYQMAYRISNVSATEITHIISQVTFPVYSKLQDDLPELKRIYLKVLQAITFFSFPLGGLIFILAPDFIKIFLGEKWMPAALATQILCIFGVLRSVSASMGPIWYGVGRPNLQVKLGFYHLLFLIIIIYPLTVKFKLLGVCLAVTFSNLFVVAVGISILAKLNLINFRPFFKLLFFPFVSTFLFLLVIHRLKYILNYQINLLLLILLILISAIIYISLSLVWDKYTSYKIKGFWDIIFKGFKNRIWLPQIIYEK